MTKATAAQNTAELLVRVWGMNADGRAFFQNVTARNLTDESAQLTGIDHALKVGEIIGVQHADKKARVKVVGVADGGLPGKITADVRIMSGQPCPWEGLAATQQKKEAETSRRSNQRQFRRVKTRFPLELRDERGRGTVMQTNSADITGRGCYVETMVPLPLGTRLNVTFWIESTKIATTGIVRSSDPGVGMGIEFTGLNEESKERFQRHLESLADLPMRPQNPS
jgi:PilZ domain